MLEWADKIISILNDYKWIILIGICGFIYITYKGLI